MIWILTHGLFLTCTESPYFYQAYTTWKIEQVTNVQEKVPLLGKAVPCSWWRIPILPGSFFEVNCLYAPCPPLTPAPTFRKKDIYLSADNVNMPAASFRHRGVCCLQLIYSTYALLQFFSTYNYAGRIYYSWLCIDIWYIISPNRLLILRNFCQNLKVMSSKN